MKKQKYENYLLKTTKNIIIHNIQIIFDLRKILMLYTCIYNSFEIKKKLKEIIKQKMKNKQMINW